MCEPADRLDILRRVPWSVGALANSMPQGSTERRLAECVYASVRQDVEQAIAAWEAERKRK